LCNFNTHSINEIIVYFFDGSADSDFIKEYDVWLEKRQEWKDLNKAFQDKDVITDTYNTSFFEPSTEDDRLRGYIL